MPRKTISRPAPPKEKEDLYVSSVTIRLVKKDRDSLMREAERRGTTISEVARRRILDPDSEILNDISDSEATKRMLLNAKSVRQNFKSINEEFHEIGRICEKHIESESYASFKRDIAGLSVLLVELQRSVNSFLEQNGVKEIHAASKISTDSVGAGNTEDKSKIQFMQKIIIRGVVNDDPRSFKLKSGKDMMSIRVRTENTLQSGKTKMLVYEVLADFDEGLFASIAKDSSLTVIGDFDLVRIEKDGKFFTVPQITNPTISL